MIIRGGGIDSSVKLCIQSQGANGSYNFYDSSQSRNTITPYNSPQVSTTKSVFGGRSFYTDYTQYLTVTNAGAFDFTQDWAIGFWFNRNSDQYGTVNRGYLSTSPIANTDGFQLLESTTNLTFWDGGGYEHIYATIPTSNTWVYVMLISISDAIKIYLNGVQSGSTYNSAISYSTSSTMYIMSRYTDPSVRGIEGYFDNFTIWIGHIPDPTKVPTRRLG